LKVTLLFPVIDESLFGMGIKIACTNCPGVCLRDRDDNVEAHVLGPQTRAYHGLWGRKCLFEDVNYFVQARIGTTVLNKLMGTTGRAENVGY
jgi:hypothetical protein